MPSDSTADSPPIPVDQWATPEERQEAARQVYRRSVAAGRPLTGVQLGPMFNRSPRWGVGRIAEVRAEDQGRSNGDDAASIGENRGAAAGSTATLPIGSNANPTNPHAGLDPHSPLRNGNDPAEQLLPIRSRRNGSTLPIRTNGNGPQRHDTPPHAAAEPTATETDHSSPQPSHPGSRSLLDTAVTLVVAVVAAAASYGHMLEVARLAGEHIWIARAFPITVDGLVLAALRRGEEGRRWLALGAAVSVAANVLAQFPELAASAGPVVSAWPPLALYGTHRLLAGHRNTHPANESRRRQSPQEDHPTTPPP